jgi:hypothetical protein
MTAALDALARLDFDTVLPEDAAVLEVFERHCQRHAFEPPVYCLICGAPDGPECDRCTAAHDFTITRLADI